MSHDVHTNVEALVESFAHHLVVSLLNLDMHAVGSSLVEDTARQMLRDLMAATTAAQATEIPLEITPEQLIYEGAPLVRASLQAGRLIRLCRERGIATLIFDRRLGVAELLRFLELLRDDLECAAFARGHQPTAFSQRGIAHIRVELMANREVDGAVPRQQPPSGVIRHYQAMANVLQDSHVAAYRGDDLEIAAASSVVEQTISAMDQQPSNLLTLAMNDNIDQFTVGHSVRVTLLALHVGQHLDIDRRDLMRLGTAALLHDIGKSRVPQEVLFKAGRLDEEERRVMANHSRWGGELLLEHGGIDHAAVGAAFCHHMGPEGAGYPARAPMFEPSGISKLVRVCDVFEALTSVRPYKAALHPLHAYSIMHRMRDGFDPAWLRFFMKCIGLFPTGTHVVLDTGEEAVVVAEGDSLRHPIIELISGPGGTPLETDAPSRFAIGESVDGVVRHVHTVVGAGNAIEIPRDLLSGDSGCAC